MLFRKHYYDRLIIIILYTYFFKIFLFLIFLRTFPPADTLKMQYGISLFQIHAENS